MKRVGLRTALTLACTSAASAALAAGAGAAIHKSTTQLFTVRPQTTRTLTVFYPDALEFAGARYSGSVRVIVSAATGLRTPRASLVRILHRGSGEGGSVFTVRVRNSNPSGTASVRIRVTATTVT
jgi:hypothetical protein